LSTPLASPASIDHWPYYQWWTSFPCGWKVEIMRDCDMQCGNISYRCNIPHREVPAVDRGAAAGWAEDGKGRSA